MTSRAKHNACIVLLAITLVLYRSLSENDLVVTEVGDQAKMTPEG